MKKKVNKIPKYSVGTPGVYYPDFLNSQVVKDFNALADSADVYFQLTNPQSNELYWAKQNMNDLSLTDPSKNTQKTQNLLNQTLGSAASGATMGMMAGGPIGGIIGAGAGALTSLAPTIIGSGGSVDEVTGEITNPSGIAGLFGHSKGYLQRKSNRIKNTNLAKQKTQALQLDWQNQRINPAPNVLAAEGGIMRQPVDALVSKGELIYNPVTKKLSKVPGSNGKPNKKDDVYARLAEGDVVISNSPTMLMANGKTPAQNLEGLVDKYATGGTVKAREAIIKKVVNWQEANKTKPQEYAKFDEGTDKEGVQKRTLFNQRNRNSILGRWLREYDKYQDRRKADAIVKFLEFVDNGGEYRVNKYGGVEVKNSDGKWYSYTDGFDFDTKQLASVNQTKSSKYITPDVLEKAQYLKGIYGVNVPMRQSNIELDSSALEDEKRLDYMIDAAFYGNSDDRNGSNAITVVNGKDNTNTGLNKNTSGKATRTNNQNFITKPIQVTSKLDTTKFGTSAPSFDISKLSNNDYKFSKADNYVPVTKMDINPDEYVEEEPLPGATNRSNANWQDALYRTAVLTQPLWGKAKAEPVNYEIANAKYLPTYVNIDPALRAIDESMGIARYNQANINPNTGAGMAYGLQAAANRAKQYADTYAYKQNAQNELIGKNVGIYNQWAQNKATTMNNVYDKVAANRTTARNINRQNVSAALTNYGQMLSDDKKMAMERMKFNILKPAIRSTYEDATANDLMNMYNSLFR